ncbi:uncharacterized protein LOC134193000 [Corticium candelabrum]|uniref:uncharacterized protein LOC134193000 n=1 Tax=Corticium candelabrum TaxID=121492 RepID=UPI002E26CF9C|nr:uncharacterized protein LOC134193000 [Corticium candelabrum]
MTYLLVCISLLSLSAFTDAGEYCSGYGYCSGCCCRNGYGCCTCTLHWWAWLLIVVSVLIIIAIAVGCGVWRRRVYLQRQTIVTTMVPNQVGYAQGYAPQGYAPQGYPPQGYPPQGYPPQYSAANKGDPF